MARQANVFNPAEGDSFQIECGPIRGIIEAKTEGKAFRNLMKITGHTKRDFAILARLRLVRVVHGRIYRSSPWFWQDPNALVNVV